jgi:hypothetical protein
MENVYDEYLDRDYNTMLLNLFPNLKEEFDEYTSWQEGIDTGSTLVYEDVFIPYAIEQIANNNQEEISKIIHLIDEMVNSNNRYCQNLVEVAVLEALRADPEGQKIRDYLTDNSLSMYDGLSMFK